MLSRSLNHLSAAFALSGLLISGCAFVRLESAEAKAKGPPAGVISAGDLIVEGNRLLFNAWVTNPSAPSSHAILRKSDGSAIGDVEFIAECDGVRYNQLRSSTVSSTFDHCSFAFDKLTAGDYQIELNNDGKALHRRDFRVVALPGIAASKPLVIDPLVTAGQLRLDDGSAGVTVPILATRIARLVTVAFFEGEKLLTVTTVAAERHGVPIDIRRIDESHVPLLEVVHAVVTQPVLRCGAKGVSALVFGDGTELLGYYPLRLSDTGPAQAVAGANKGDSDFRIFKGDDANCSVTLLLAQASSASPPEGLLRVARETAVADFSRRVSAITARHGHGLGNEEHTLELPFRYNREKLLCAISLETKAYDAYRAVYSGPDPMDSIQRESAVSTLTSRYSTNSEAEDASRTLAAVAHAESRAAAMKTAEARELVRAVAKHRDGCVARMYPAAYAPLLNPKLPPLLSEVAIVR